MKGIRTLSKQEILAALIVTFIFWYLVLALITIREKYFVYTPSSEESHQRKISQMEADFEKLQKSTIDAMHKSYGDIILSYKDKHSVELRELEMAHNEEMARLSRIYRTSTNIYLTRIESLKEETEEKPDLQVVYYEEGQQLMWEHIVKLYHDPTPNERNIKKLIIRHGMTPSYLYAEDDLITTLTIRSNSNGNELLSDKITKFVTQHNIPINLAIITTKCIKE